jgi:2-dehydro-3-deoxygalactonokinase
MPERSGEARRPAFTFPIRVDQATGAMFNRGMEAALIGVDWGSSSFRAYLMSARGEVLDETASGDGIASVTTGAYPATLKRLIGRWLDANPSAPVIASGMVGSRHGWREAPYVKCPAGPRDVAERLVMVDADGRRVFLAPGLSTDEAGAPDVMRGEETEIFGLADLGAGLVVLPGSHSKWARIEGERVAVFKTFVTGELFAALRDHTVAGAFAKAAPAKAPGEAFALGVERGAAAASGKAKSGLLGLLFGARVLPLMGALAEDDAGEYLSGLLIGAEIGEARRLYPAEEPHVAGAETLVQRYLAAFAALSVGARAAPARAAARGLFRIARDGGLL